MLMERVWIKVIPNGSYIAVKLNYPVYNLEDEDIVVFSENGEYSLKIIFLEIGKI